VFDPKRHTIWLTMRHVTRFPFAADASSAWDRSVPSGTLRCVGFCVTDGVVGDEQAGRIVYRYT
jgi:hypothetical protein